MYDDDVMHQLDVIAARAHEEEARRRRAAQKVLGLFAAFGRFAFTQRKPRSPRHADTWRSLGPHGSARECERRARQMERARLKAIRKQMAIG